MKPEELDKMADRKRNIQYFCQSTWVNTHDHRGTWAHIML